MALNLTRNSRVWVTSNLDGNGDIALTGFTPTNTQEIQILAGYAASQSTEAQVVTVAEAGEAPLRSQRSFNTKLNPVDWSLTQYVRPDLDTVAVPNRIIAEEAALLNAMFSPYAIGTKVTMTFTSAVYTYTAATASTPQSGVLVITGTGITGAKVGDVVTVQGLTLTVPGANDLANMNSVATITAISGTSITIAYSQPAAITGTTPVIAATGGLFLSAWSYGIPSIVTPGNSNVNQLQRIGLIFQIDNVTYLVNRVAVNGFSLDFGLDQISQYAFTGFGESMRETASALTVTGSTFSGALTGTFTAKLTVANYITNKLTTVKLVSVDALGTTPAGGEYKIALTGGSMTFDNGIQYLTPENLAVVNLPIGYYTGTRSMTGTMTAYLKTGAGVQGTGQMLADMLADASKAIEPMFTMQISVGGSNNAVKVVFDMMATLTIPSVKVEDVVSTDINFTAASWTKATNNTTTPDFSLDYANEFRIGYYSN